MGIHDVYLERMNRSRAAADVVTAAAFAALAEVVEGTAEAIRFLELGNVEAAQRILESLRRAVEAALDRELDAPS